MHSSTYSSREFNQNASAVRKASYDGPVFITVRGKPESVMLSFKEYRRLTGKKRNIIDSLNMPELSEIADDFDEELDYRLKGTIRPAEFD